MNGWLGGGSRVCYMVRPVFTTGTILDFLEKKKQKSNFSPSNHSHTTATTANGLRSCLLIRADRFTFISYLDFIYYICSYTDLTSTFKAGAMQELLRHTCEGKDLSEVPKTLHTSCPCWSLYWPYVERPLQLLSILYLLLTAAWAPVLPTIPLKTKKKPGFDKSWSDVLQVPSCFDQSVIPS